MALLPLWMTSSNLQSMSPEGRFFPKEGEKRGEQDKNQRGLRCVFAPKPPALAEGPITGGRSLLRPQRRNFSLRAEYIPAQGGEGVVRLQACCNSCPKLDHMASIRRRSLVTLMAGRFSKARRCHRPLPPHSPSWKDGGSPPGCPGPPHRGT